MERGGGNFFTYQCRTMRKSGKSYLKKTEFNNHKHVDVTGKILRAYFLKRKFFIRFAKQKQTYETKNEYIQLLHASDKLLSQQFDVRSLRLKKKEFMSYNAVQAFIDKLSNLNNI